MTPDEPGPPVKAATQLLNGLAIAASTYRLYGNASQPGFERALELVRGVAAAEQPIRIRVLRDRFEVDLESLVPTTDALSTLAADLYERGVIEIRMRSAPEAQELFSFAALIAGGLEDVEAEGGPKSFLDRRGVLAFAVTARDLSVADAQSVTPEMITLSNRIRDLLGNQQSLAQEIESSSMPLEAYGKLRSLIDEGLEGGVDRSELDGGIADTIAAMSEKFRANLVSIAIQRLAQDELAMTITGQLSEGELAGALVLIAGQLGAEDVMADAVRVAESTRGRRSELPLIVARRLIDAGMDRDTVMGALAGAHGGADAAAIPPAGGLSIEAAEEELDFAELRGEATEPGPEADLDAGTVTLRALLRAAGADQEFEELVDFAEHSVVRWTHDRTPEKSLAVLQVIVTEAEQQSDPARRERLERAARSVVSAEMVAALLEMSAGQSEPIAGRLLDILRERSIPALLAHLAEESDRSRRKILVEMLVEVGRNDVTLLVPSLNDDRWYFVRNVASILGRIHLPEAVPHLIRLCTHADARVRREALRGSAAIGGNSAVPAIARATRDADDSVRMAAIAGLGLVPNPEASTLLMKIAGDKKRGVKERKEALTSLRLHADRQSLEFLQKTAARKWPPSALTRQLAAHTAGLLKRPPPRSEPS